jgi:hypothetical protein
LNAGSQLFQNDKCRLVTLPKLIRNLALPVAAVSLGLSGWSGPAQHYLPLFAIERSHNANIIQYDAKLGPDGKLDPHQPVVAYWIMAAEDGRREPLGLLDRTKFYGFSTEALGAGAYRLTMVSVKTRHMEITLQGQTAHAETQIGTCRAYLQRIFVTTRKTMGLNMPQWAELFGAEIGTGRPCYEKIFP